MPPFVKVGVVLICALLLNTCGSRLASEPRGDWVRLRYVIYEDRLASYQTGCPSQHLREHLLARQIDDAMAHTTAPAYFVDGLSTNDKIILSLNIFDPESKDSEIAFEILSELRRGLEIRFIHEEIPHVNLEETQSATYPDFATHSIARIFTRIGMPPPTICSAVEYSHALTGEGDNIRPPIDVYQFKTDGSYETLSTGLANGEQQRSIWRSVLPSALDSRISVAGPPRAQVFLGIGQSVSANDHVAAVANIYRHIAEQRIDDVSISPFGIGGFVIAGPRDEVSALAGILKSQRSLEQFSNPNADQIEAAYGYVCGYKSVETELYAPLRNEPISHPYFEFRQTDDFCSDNSLGSTEQTASEYLVAELQPISAGRTPRSHHSVSDIRLCDISYDTGSKSTEERLRIAAFALRHHLRYDAAIALNVDVKAYSDGCLEMGAIIPPENRAKFLDFVQSFDGTDQDFIRRVKHSQVYYYCGSERLSPCGTSIIHSSAAQDSNDHGEYKSWLGIERVQS